MIVSRNSSEYRDHTPEVTTEKLVEVLTVSGDAVFFDPESATVPPSRNAISTGQKWKTLKNLAREVGAAEPEVRTVLDSNEALFQRAAIGGIPVYKLREEDNASALPSGRYF